MKSRTTEYYDWFEDVQPVLVGNLNQFLSERRIEPINDLHGGYFKSNKWVEVGQGEYINFWHVYLDHWGAEIRNDQFVKTYFPPDDDEEWDYLKQETTESRNETAALLLDAVRKMLKDHGFYDEQGECEPMTIWYSW